MKKILSLFALIFILAIILFAWPEKMPSYTPIRDYIDVEEQILEAFILAKDSSTIQLPEGHFLFSKSLSLDGKKHVRIKGMGMNKTILSFKGQTQGAEGIKITNSEHIIIEDLAVEDAAGDNIKVSDTDTITFRNIRSAWTGRVSTNNGAYAIYPVLSTHVLIEGCEAIGSSDAGIYVGQSQHVIIRNNKAYFNVAGIESENSLYVEIYGNEAYKNTSGLLIFNLPELTVYGHHIRAYQNTIYDNNIPNFGVKGSIVSAVPKGTGVVIMASQNVEFINNVVKDHKTSNLSVVSYKVFAADEDPESNALSEAAQAQGLRGVQADFENDVEYNAFPGNVTVSNNQFSNRFYFPTLSNDFGKLWYFKNSMRIPDIAYDGILPKGTELQAPSVKICIQNNENAQFVFLDAANDFESFSNDSTPFNCSVSDE